LAGLPSGPPGNSGTELSSLCTFHFLEKLDETAILLHFFLTVPQIDLCLGEICTYLGEICTSV
jgi:hypothetical protein